MDPVGVVVIPKLFECLFLIAINLKKKLIRVLLRFVSDMSWRSLEMVPGTGLPFLRKEYWSRTSAF